MSRFSNQSKILILLVAAGVLSLAFQNCGGPSMAAYDDGSESARSIIDGAGILCPSDADLSCNSGEDRIRVENEFGCSYSICRKKNFSGSFADIRCTEPTVPFCTTGLVPTIYTDLNSCQISACVPQPAGSGLGYEGGTSGTCTAIAFVCQAYSDILGRLPDQQGAQYYTGLINGASTDAQKQAMYTTIVVELANSPEAKGEITFNPSAQPMCTGAVSCR